MLASVSNDSAGLWMKITDLSNFIFNYCVEEKPSLESACNIQKFAQSLFNEAEGMKKLLSSTNFSIDSVTHMKIGGGFVDSIAEPTFSKTGIMAGPYSSHAGVQNIERVNLRNSNTCLKFNQNQTQTQHIINQGGDTSQLNLSTLGKRRKMETVIQPACATLNMTYCGVESNISNNSDSFVENQKEVQFSFFGMSDIQSQSDESFPPPAKRKRKTQIIDRKCKICGDTQTPEWRKGPQGSHTLCNACGLNYAKKIKQERASLEKQGRRKQSIDVIIDNCKYKFSTQIQTERSKKKLEATKKSDL